MIKEKIIKVYLEKINLFQKQNKTYYDKDKPIVTDQTYDL